MRTPVSPWAKLRARTDPLIAGPPDALPGQVLLRGVFWVLGLVLILGAVVGLSDRLGAPWLILLGLVVLCLPLALVAAALATRIAKMKP